MYAVGLWGIGLGGGYVLGFDLLGNTPVAVRGAAGFWLGNSISLSLVSVALFWYMRRVQHIRETEG